MSDATDGLSTHTEAPAASRRGRDARRAARIQRSGVSIPYITRNLPLTQVLSEEAMQTIEHNAETLLEEIGIEFREYPRALELLKGAGADIKGDRVRFPRGLARKLIQTAPQQFTQQLPQLFFRDLVRLRQSAQPGRVKSGSSQRRQQLLRQRLFAVRERYRVLRQVQPGSAALYRRIANEGADDSLPQRVVQGRQRHPPQARGVHALFVGKVRMEIRESSDRQSL